MDRCTSCSNTTEILLKTVLNTIQSINESLLPVHLWNKYRVWILQPSLETFLVFFSGFFDIQPFPKLQIVDSSKLKEFADDNFICDENGVKFSKWVENTGGNGEIAHIKQFLLFSSTGRRPASYCHCVVSVVHACFRQFVCLSVGLSVSVCVCVSVRKLFKKLLHRNYWLDFYKISQECSLGGPLSNSFN